MAARRTQVRTYAQIGRLLLRNRSVGSAGVAGGTPHAAEDERRAGEQLAGDLERMGPTFVKLGQLLSTRSDLLPEPYLEALSRLQDQVSPLPAEVVRRAFEDEIGAGVGDVFAEFDETPLGSASLGQVHRATTRDGRAVVVKVQRPGVEEQVAADVATLGELARMLDDHTDAGRRFGFADLFGQFRRSLLDELDYRTEAANLVRLGEVLADHPLVVVPRPMESFSGARVLTMEHIAGRKVTDIGPFGRLELKGAALADGLIEAYLDQIFVHGFFHADPHPGNVLLTDDGRIGLVDLGMVGYLREQVRSALVRLVLAAQAGRGEECAEVLFRLGRPLEDFDEPGLQREVSELLARRTAASVGELSGGELVMHLSRVCGECGLRPPAELAMVARALLSLERVAVALDPNFDAGQSVADHAAELLSPQLRPSPSGVVGALLDARDFAEQLPGRINRVMDSLAHGELRLRVHAFDETEMLRSLQKLANRLAMGLVIAALLVGAAILTRAPSSSRILGYPSVALVCFLVAVACGLALMASIVLSDRHVKQRWRRRRHR
ncbi:MAG TPA: AarF/UbiB family protein [Acidimicrobiales bacterium]|nr:AarF/UbiB family protein [Acidimicrobiales bacterium]